MAGVLTIRADASTRIGAGHVMRCLALAQTWQDNGGRAVFLMAEGVDSFSERLAAEGMEVQHLPVEPGGPEDASETTKIAQSLGASWLVVDGYGFGSDYQKFIKNSGLRLMFIDDNGHCDHYYADIVLNQNLHANESMYQSRDAHTKLFLGMKYVLLRREFLKYRDWKREIPEVARKVLVTLGGGDPENVTLKVIKALRQVDIDGLAAIVVVGANNPHYEELEKAVSGCRFQVELRRNVTDMPDLMAWADLAVSAAGSTSWELAFMGLPAALISTADNQRLIVSELVAAGAAADLDRHTDVTEKGIAQVISELNRAFDERSTMTRKGRELVDGGGAVRVVEKLLLHQV